MGYPALDFRQVQNDLQQTFRSPEEEELSDLLKFLEKPQSVGLNNVKESLRNTVLLLMAMSGLDTGYRYTPIMGDDYPSLSLGGNAEYQRKKKKKKQQLWDQMLELDRLLVQSFAKIFEHTHEIIFHVIKDIDHKIQVLDTMIQTNKDDGFFSDEDLREAKQEIHDLKDLKTEVKDLETELNHTKSTVEVIEIEKKLDDRISNFQTPVSNKPNPFFKTLKNSLQKKKKNDPLSLGDEVGAAAVAAEAADHTADTDTHAPSAEDSHEPADTDSHAASTETDNSPSFADTVSSSHGTEAEAVADVASAPAAAADISGASDGGGDSSGDAGDHGTDQEADHAVTSVAAAAPAADNTHGSSDGDSDDDTESGEEDNEDEDDLEPPAPLI